MHISKKFLKEDYEDLFASYEDNLNHIVMMTNNSTKDSVENKIYQVNGIIYLI